MVSINKRYNRLNDIEKKVIMMRLKGFSYKRINKYIDRKGIYLKKTDARRLIDKILEDGNSYEENKYREIFGIFDWNETSFCRVFCESKITYLYLNYSMGSGIFTIPSYFKFSGNEEGVKYKGVRFKFNVNSFLHLLLIDEYMKNSKKCYTVEELTQKAVDFYEKIQLQEVKQALRNNKNIMEVYVGKYYFYNNKKLESKFRSFERCLLQKNGLYSINSIYTKEKEFYNELGIESSIALYDLTRKYKSNFQTTKIIRPIQYPYILFGYKNKKYYFEYLIKRYHNLSIENVINMLALENGIEKSYLRSNLIKLNKDKISNDGIIRNTPLTFTERQIELLRKKLTKDYYRTEEFLAILRKVKQNTPNRILETDEIFKLGYRKEYNYAIKCSILDIKEAIKNEICSKDFFRLNIHEDIDNLKRGVIDALISNYNIVRISDEEMITGKKLRKINLYKKDIFAFFKQIEQNIGKEEYFTVEQLYEMGCFELIENNSFDYRFYQELIKVSNRFQCIQIDGERLYCVTKNKVNRKLFIKKCLDEFEENIHIYDIIEYIKNEYKVAVTHHTVKDLAKDLGYYYDDTFEKIYKDKNIFLKEVFDNEYVN